MNMQNYVQILTQWKSLGNILKSQPVSTKPTWDLAYRLTQAAKPKFIADGNELRQLLEKSTSRLLPFDDPLLLDMGLNRWLSKHREESYSDWFAWVIEQLPNSTYLFEMLDLEYPPSLASWHEKPKIRRELTIPTSEDTCGKLDITIEYGNEALLVLEMKLIDADKSDVAKQEAYAKWIKDCNSHIFKHAIMIVTEGDEDNYWEFQTRTWSDTCIVLRRFCMNGDEVFTINARALVLSFIGAVEQNVLKWKSQYVKSMCRGRTQRFDVSLLQHLESVFEAEG